MAKHRGPVLVDTNVILESYRIGAWQALSGGYPVETVEDCVTETQTGFQRRQPEQLIDSKKLRTSMATVHGVTDGDLAAVSLKAPDIALDKGEHSLWAHAYTRTDKWVLCGPDKASLRFGVRLGFRDRLFALEQLLDAVGYRPKQSLNTAYTRNWLNQTLNELVISEGI